MKLARWLRARLPRNEPATPSRMLEEQDQFILYELKRINETIRYEKLGATPLGDADAAQTRSSFDFQWSDMHTGVAMSDDRAFMESVPSLVCEMTDLPREWFAGKRVVDVGCGAGRYSYGLLSLGASVTACDQSPAALARTRELCRPFGERLSTREINLLEWKDEEGFDLAFCFGVVHHTGNTYLAIRNVTRKVKPGGRVFLMVYGFPENGDDFAEVNGYEALRQELRALSFDERKDILTKKFGENLAHGWFDAVSPRVNDLLTFDEIRALLGRLGFHRVKRTKPHRNHHLVADRLAAS